MAFLFTTVAWCQAGASHGASVFCLVVAWGWNSWSLGLLLAGGPLVGLVGLQGRSVAFLEPECIASVGGCPSRVLLSTWGMGIGRVGLLVLGGGVVRPCRGEGVGRTGLWLLDMANYGLGVWSCEVAVGVRGRVGDACAVPGQPLCSSVCRCLRESAWSVGPCHPASVPVVDRGCRHRSPGRVVLGPRDR